MKHIILSVALIFSASTATAASTYYESDAELKSAKKLLYQERYTEAIGILKDTVASEPDNADAWNLLGYAERKTGNLKQSAVAYNKALGINPNHKDALEYQGELFLMQGDIAAAQENLAKLQSLCPNGCEQVDMLMEAIASQ